MFDAATGERGGEEAAAELQRAQTQNGQRNSATVVSRLNKNLQKKCGFWTLSPGKMWVLKHPHPPRMRRPWVGGTDRGHYKSGGVISPPSLVPSARMGGGLPAACAWEWLTLLRHSPWLWLVVLSWERCILTNKNGATRWSHRQWIFTQLTSILFYCQSIIVTATA